MKTNRHFGVAAIAAFTLLGCKETTSSEFIRTGGIAALISATAESGDSSKVHVELRVGGAQSNTYVILQGGDDLTAKVGTETKDLQAVDEGVYEGTFANGGKVDITVSLDRDEDEDAPDSIATLPASFTIAQPQPEDVLSRADDGLFIAWTPVENAEGTINLSGVCIANASYSVSGTAGMLVVNKGELKSFDEMKPESCTVDIDISFQRQGAADPAFDEESYFRTFQKRKAYFTSDP